MKNRLFLLILILFLIPLSIYSQDEPNNDDKNKIEEEKIEGEEKAEVKKEKDESGDEKKVKKDEKRFQFGIGIHANSLNFSGMNEVYNIFQSIKDDEDYSYPGISDLEEDSIQDLSNWHQKDLLASYIFRNQEYGMHLRILWNVLIFETDFDFLPMDYTDSKRSNIMIAPMIGIRYPSFIMPYLMIGPNLNVGFETTDTGSWEDKISTIKNSMIFTPGLILKTGLDFKAQYFSIGLYYQYRLKDFNEITYWYSIFKEGYISNTDAFWNIISSQSRIGLTFSVYFF